MARRPLLTQAQLDYLLRAERIKQKLSRKVLAKRWGVSVSTLHHYVIGNRTTVEEWQNKRAPAREQRRIARLRTPFKHGSEHRAIGARGFI
jgi:transcriptional regulator with XRE-family HTH domain